MATDFQEKARRLRNAVEPVAAGVYFAPEAHQAYEALGFGGSPVAQDGVAKGISGWVVTVTLDYSASPPLPCRTINCRPKKAFADSSAMSLSASCWISPPGTIRY